ncbi:MAG: hypothetical protein HFJ29_04505 [Clostridia bacterium]|nr:hypothetical protein [Clostridia bacterium]
MRKQTKEKKQYIRNFILSVIAILLLSHMIVPQISYAMDLELKVKTELDIKEIIANNSRNVKKEEIVTKPEDIEYTTKYIENPELPKGMLQVMQEGIDGQQEVYTKKVFEGEELISEEQMSSKVTKSSVNKMVAIGTAPYSSNYKVKVGDNMYVTSSLLAIRIEPNDKAQKLISLNRDAQVKLLKKKEEWYQVQYQSYIGWAKAECFTYLDPNSNKENISITNQYTKQQLLNRLSFNMPLNKPSGLSLEQFKKLFANEPKDTKNIFKNNAQYFYYAEKQYHVNGVFIAAVAIHESGWGSSAIANDKNNLFGYGAYDSSPYESSYQFSHYSEGIDLIARVFAKYYLNPAGTKIYDGNTAVGTYYNGPTLSGVNVRYASDKNWANGVYTWMQYLYQNL